MKHRLWKICLTATLFALGCLSNEARAQNVPVPVAPVAQVVEELPDGQGYVVRIGDTEYRALPPAALRKIAARLQSGAEATAENALLRQQVELLQRQNAIIARQIALADRQTEIERERAAGFQDLYLAERDLRVKAVALVGKRGRLAAFLTHPATKTIISAVPVIFARVKF